MVTDNKFDLYNITEIADKKYKILDKALKNVISIAEGGEVVHYEGLDSLAKEFKDKDLAKKTKSILTEEKNHLDQ